MKILLPFFLAFFPLFIYSQNSLNTIGAGARYVDIGDLDITGSQITVEAIIRKSKLHICNVCKKEYTARNSLWYHKKKCNTLTTNVIFTYV